MNGSLRTTLLRLSAFALLAAALIMLLASSASPLFDATTSDYATFTFIADAIRDGATPYVDYFDNKGPLLYIIDATGRTLLPGKWGIFVLEIISLTITCELLWRTAHTLGASHHLNILCTAVSAVIFGYHIVEGNTTEEWSLPLIALAQMLLVHLFVTREQKSPQTIITYAAVVGATFMALLLLRPNNAAPIAGGIVAVAICLVTKRQFKTLFLSSLSFVGSVAVVLIPILLWLNARDAVGAARFAIVDTNIQYFFTWDPEATSPTRMVTNCLQMAVVFIAPIVARRYDRRHDSRLFMPTLATAAVIFATLLTGTGWSHYYLLVLPFVWLTTAMTHGMRMRSKIIIIATMILPEFALHPLAIPYAAKTNISRSIAPYDDTQTLDTLITSTIPEDERTSIYMACAPGDIDAFTRLGIRPVGRYSSMQDRAAALGANVCQDIAEAFTAAEPLWIITYLPIERYTPPLPATTLANYTLVTSAEPSPLGYAYRLYRLK